MAARGRGVTIAAGAHRGRRLRVSAGVRPTTDRVRAAVFDALGAPPARVLDLYAGCGAYGIEALSRGADYACFVERSRRAAAAIAHNLASLGLHDRGVVVVGDAQRPARARGGPFGLVFADPPYAHAPWATLFDALGAPGLLDRRAVLVAETGSRAGPPEPSAGWLRRKERRHGDTVFTIFTRHNDDAPRREGQGSA